MTRAERSARRQQRRSIALVVRRAEQRRVRRSRRVREAKRMFPDRWEEFLAADTITKLMKAFYPAKDTESFLYDKNLVTLAMLPKVCT